MIQPVDKRSQRLFMELGTALQLSFEDPDRSVAGELTGMRVGEYLIVRILKGSLEKTAPVPGNPVMVRYILSDDVFGFKTRIIRTIQDPDNLVFLSYPEEVKSCNIRAEKRVDCYLPARIVLEGEGPEDASLPAVIVNINKNGCLSLVDNCPELDCCRTVPVTVKLPFGQFDTLILKGEIRTEARHRNQARLGILFDELDAFSKKVLATLVPALNL